MVNELVKEQLKELLFFFKISTQDRTLNDLSKIISFFIDSKNNNIDFISLKELNEKLKFNYKTLTKNISLLIANKILLKEELLTNEIILKINKKPFEFILTNHKNVLKDIEKTIKSIENS